MNGDIGSLGPTTGRSSSPRSIVVINGKSYTPESWTHDANGHGVIDTATIILPTKGNPDFAAMAKPGQGLPVAIYAGFPSNPAPGGFGYQQLSQRFVGTINNSDPTFSLTDNMASLPCVSFGAVLTRTKTTTNVGGSTASSPAGSVAGNLAGVTTAQYVQSVAGQHNMTADVRVNNPATMQQVFASNQIVGMQNLRIWDVLVACAITDGAYLWFSGTTLHYVDPGLINRTIIPIAYGSLVGPESFAGNHALQYSKNIKVQVLSYRTKEKTSCRTRVHQGTNGSVVVNSCSRSFTMQNFGNPGSSFAQTSSTYNSDGTVTTSYTAGSSSATGGETSSGYLSTPTDSSTETYKFKRWGLTQAQCDALALNLWRQLSGHEYRATFKLPVTPDLLADLSITSKFRFSDLPWPSFNQDYIPLRLTEEFSMSNGWTVEPLGINHALPQNAA
jgi:hypothetical protein